MTDGIAPTTDGLTRHASVLSSLQINSQLLARVGPKQMGRVSGTRQHRKVNPNEFCPRGRALALRRWRYAAAAQNIANGLIRNRVAQIGQLWGAN